MQECPSRQGLGGACSALLPSCGSTAANSLSKVHPALAVLEEPLMWAQLERLLHMFCQSQSAAWFSLSRAVIYQVLPL